MAKIDLVAGIKKHRRPLDWTKLDWGEEGGGRVYVHAREIARLEKEVRRAVLIRAAQLARQLCPVDTGDLKRSIGYRTADGTLRATAPYAAYQEFGTYKMRAQPYLFPALRQALSEIGRSRRVTQVGEINEP